MMRSLPIAPRIFPNTGSPYPAWWADEVAPVRFAVMAPIVHLRRAVALIGRFPALAGVDLDVDPGEIVLLRGPNGAGKTTLLRVCAGLVPVVVGRGGRAGPATWSPTGRRFVGGSACSATPPSSTTT